MCPGPLIRRFVLAVIADIHIKLGQKNVPKEWAINRYEMFFNQVTELEKKVDMLVIPGDIFDRMPTLEELTLYFQFVAQRKKNNNFYRQP